MERKLKRYQEPRNGIQYIVEASTRQELSPFVFFDAGTMKRSDDGLFIGMHPHSGIGIITLFEGADLKHDDTGHNEGIVRDGGVQWIQAGGGVFHEENYLRPTGSDGSPWSLSLYQLWMQLPPELEEVQVGYMNVQPEEIPKVDRVKVIVGEYQGIQSPLEVPYNMTYLTVDLKPGEHFEFHTPPRQTTGFIFPSKGDLTLFGEEIPMQRLSVLQHNEGEIRVEAASEGKFVLLLAEPQSYPIVSYGGSIHTNKDSLMRSLDRIDSAKR